MDIDTNAPVEAVPAESGMKSQDTGLKKPAAAEPTPVEEAKPTDAVATDDDAGEEADEHGDESETDDDAQAAEHTTGKKKLPRWMKKRIARAEQKGYNIAKAELTALSPKAAPEPVQVAQEQEKTLADFDFDQAKFDDYRIERAVEKRLEAREAKAAEEREAKLHEQAKEQFLERVDQFEDAVGEGAYEEMLKAEINTPPVMIELLNGHERDLEIGLYLARNPDECDRIAELSPLKMAKELDKIDALIADGYFAQPGSVKPKNDTKAEPAKTPAPKPKPKLTNAPPPAKTITSTSSSTKSPDDEGLSTAERIALWRNERRSKQGR